MLKDDYKIYEEKMNKSIDSAAADFASVRAGRANAAVLDRIMVDYYGTPTPIQQIAAISTPDPDSVRSVGVNDGEVPPVPIPNTEVKLTCAEDS